METSTLIVWNDDTSSAANRTELPQYEGNDMKPTFDPDQGEEVHTNSGSLVKLKFKVRGSRRMVAQVKRGEKFSAPKEFGENRTKDHTITIEIPKADLSKHNGVWYLMIYNKYGDGIRTRKGNTVSSRRIVRFSIPYFIEDLKKEKDAWGNVTLKAKFGPPGEQVRVKTTRNEQPWKDEYCKNEAEYRADVGQYEMSLFLSRNASSKCDA